MQCLSASDLLGVFGLSNASELTVGQLELICPAVVTQVLLPSCPYMTPSTIAIDPQGACIQTSLTDILCFTGCTGFFSSFFFFFFFFKPLHSLLPHIVICPSITFQWLPFEDNYTNECVHCKVLFLFSQVWFIPRFLSLRHAPSFLSSQFSYNV